MSLGHNPWGTIYWLGHMVLGLNVNEALSLRRTSKIVISSSYFTWINMNGSVNALQTANMNKIRF